jgi:hypothetical protein
MNIKFVFSKDKLEPADFYSQEEEEHRDSGLKLVST